jgi:pimeloyl-ACP methyl ester carboxylesterase
MTAFMKATAALRQNPIFAQRLNLREMLPALTKVIPTIFIWGENDIFSTRETGLAVEGLLPDVRFHWIPNAGHQTQTDAPEKVATLVRDFLTKPGAMS